MQQFKNFLLAIPEYFLILSVLFYWYSAALLLNPLAIGLLLVLIVQLVIRNQFLGVFLSSLVILAGLYMILALISELNEFPSFNNEASRMLFVGLVYLLSTVGMAGLMMYKYHITDQPTPQPKKA